MTSLSNLDGDYNNTKEMVQINGPSSPLLYVIDETGETLDEDETVVPCKTIDLVNSGQESVSSSFATMRLRTIIKQNQKSKKKKLKKLKHQVPPKGTKPKVIPGTSKRKFQKKKKAAPKKPIEIKDDPDVITIDDTASEASVVIIDENISVIEINDTDEIGSVSGTIVKASDLNENNVLNSNSIQFNEFENNNMATSTPISNKLTQKYENNWKREKIKNAKLRPVILDGSNVAFGHGKDSFSSEGIKICVDYFKQRGHNVKVFLPQFRRAHPTTRDRHLLDVLEKEGILVYTPSRRMDGRLVVSYDDRFIVEYADKVGGVIVSRDNYRDILESEPRWKETICQRLLMYTFVDNLIMFPDDPLGRNGPNLDQFLRF